MNDRHLEGLHQTLAFALIHIPFIEFRVSGASGSYQILFVAMLEDIVDSRGSKN